MYLTVDKGNTRMKWALFEGDRLVRTSEEGEGLPAAHAERAIVCATGALDLEALRLEADRVTVLTSRTRLPIGLDYGTPETLGPDRIAAACGAHRLCQGRGCVIVDAGTCITVDYLDGAGVYRGGAILPGFEMKFRALHTFTAKLPLLDNIDAQNAILTGRSTRESIQAGVVTATRLAVQGFANQYRKAYGDLHVMLTGGDAETLWGTGLLDIDNCTIHPWLVLNGLNEILNANEE